MFIIQNLTLDPNQEHHLILPDGSIVSLVLQFKPMQFGWFLTSLTYGANFVLNGLRVTNQPNLLRQWKNEIPFGLACQSAGDREPMLQEDFSSGNSKLYILTKEEVEEYERFLSA